MLASLDTETTGSDLRHGALPFFVTSCTAEGKITFWEWAVDPITRIPQVPPEDVGAIKRLVSEASTLVLQNAKFDVTALAALDPWFGDHWPWERTEDTLLAGHLLASNQPHNLTDMAMFYLGVDIEPLEKRLEKATVECRRMVQQARLRLKRATEHKTRKRRSKRHNTSAPAVGLVVDEEGNAQPDLETVLLASWRIAEEGLPEMPSAKQKTWKYDTWLPRAMVQHWWESSEAGKAWAANCVRESEPNFFRRQLNREGAAGLRGWQYRPPEVDASAGGNGTELHPYWTVLRDYSNPDGEATVALWQKMEPIIRRRDLWEIYKERCKCLPIAYGMEQRGVTLNEGRLNELYNEYAAESDRLGRVCTNIAAGLGYELVLPKSGNNDSLLTFCFGRAVEVEGEVDKAARVPSPDCLMLPVVALTDTGAPSLDKTAMDVYLSTLEARGKQLSFVRALAAKRKRDTSLAFLESYKRYWKLWVPAWEGSVDPVTGAGWYILHPNLNITGTDTLRWSSNNPNSQNVSKKEIICTGCWGEGCPACDGRGYEKRNLRYCLGPGPGREWWCMDYSNLERTLPAYEAGEEAIIALLERPNDPPYYGSEHLLVGHVLWPTEFEEVCRVPGKSELDGRLFKKRYGATLYQWTKNFNFATQYQCQERKGDATAHQVGAWRKVKSRFAKQTALNDHWVKFANEKGYVETLPDKTVNPRRGYPILCSRMESGRISPTIPLSYHIQSTAMWCTMKAMIRCQAQLDTWRVEEGFDGYIALQVHDELDFDFPAGGKRNQWRAQALQRCMEQSGDDLGIPLRVSVAYHPNNWSEEEKVA